MKIAYCATVQPSFGGLKSFNLGLTRALANMLESQGHEFILITNIKYLPDFKEITSSIEVFDGNHFWFENFRLPWLLKKLNVDLVIFPHNRIPIFRPGKYKIACIFHDLLFFRYPNQLGWAKRMFRAFQMRHAANACDYSFSVSEFTAKELAAFVPGHTSVICYQAISPQKSSIARSENGAELENLKKPFFVFIGAQSFQKNLPNLIRGFNILKDWGIDAQLVIAGGRGTAENEVEEAIKSSEHQKDIIRTGYISDARKTYLMEHAESLVFPSIYEGFGIPLLEAFELGVPVITSNVSCLPEISGGAAIETKPVPEHLALAMKSIFQDELLKKQLIENGKRRAKDFSWEKTAQIILNNCLSEKTKVR